MSRLDIKLKKLTMENSRRFLCVICLQPPSTKPSYQHYRNRKNQHVHIPRRCLRPRRRPQCCSCVKRKTSMGSICFHLCSPALSGTTKKVVYESCVRSVYVVETWAMTKDIKERLIRLDKQMLRMVNKKEYKKALLQL